MVSVSLRPASVQRAAFQRVGYDESFLLIRQGSELTVSVQMVVQPVVKPVASYKRGISTRARSPRIGSFRLDPGTLHLPRSRQNVNALFTANEKMIRQ